MSRTAAVLWAFVARDATMDMSYRLEFGLRLATVVFHVAGLYFLSRLVGRVPELEPYGGYLPFAAVGMALALFFQTAFDAFAAAIQRESLQGTLESILLAPLRLPTVVLACSAWRLVWAALMAVVYVGAAHLLYGVPLAGDPLLIAAILLLTALTFASLGMLSASFVMVYKRGDPVGLLMGGLSTLLGGVFYPLDSLPPWLQRAAQALPLTHGLDAVRRVLLRGAGLQEVSGRLLVLAAFSALGVPLGLWCFHRAVRRALREGTVLHH